VTKCAVNAYHLPGWAVFEMGNDETNEAHVMDIDESREGRRGRTLKTGKVWFNDNQSVMNCQVRDMSDNGARVRFEIPFNCPDRVALYFPIDEKQGHIRGCATKWNRGNEAGFRYTSPAMAVRLEDIPKLTEVAAWLSPTWTPVE